MFKTKKQLDKTKHYGMIIGESPNGAVYVQDEIEFDATGRRVTNLTDEEARAEKAFAALAREEAAAEEEKKSATAAVKKENAEAAEAAEAAKPPEPDKDMPDFDVGWTKAMLISHASKVFGATLDSRATHAQLVAKCKSLY
ncbi:MAG: hypothetical protein GY696_38575 [Gammaproteobacteria bacterium]|nr:hypothetical protein [Gammaproteobacteria bacterium]